MGTLRLFEQDAYLREFEANVLATSAVPAALVRKSAVSGHAGNSEIPPAASEFPAVFLDRTCFYPTSGGQPHDTGTLDDANVIAVFEEDKGIMHVLDKPLRGRAALGKIDWARRTDHMQQHSGQHILSAAFVRTLDASTESFHMGAETCTIDVAASTASDDKLAAVEEAANCVVFEDRLFMIESLPVDVVRTLPIRKMPEILKVVEPGVVVDGMHAYAPPPVGLVNELRVVSIADFDCTCCGGTHVRRAGEVGLIKILRTERFKGLLRVEFICGWRALKDYGRKNAVLLKLGSTLSGNWREVPELVDKVRAEHAAEKKVAREQAERLAEYEAREFYSTATRTGDFRLVTRVFADMEARDQKSLVVLAEKIVAQGGCVALLGSTGERVSLVFARSKDLSIDLRPAMNAATPLIGGKGGGHPGLVQGGAVASGTPDSVKGLLAEALQAAEKALPGRKG